MKMIPIILAGGKGHRLWPLSTSEMPKIFLSLDNETSLLQMTLERALLLNVTDILLVINEKHVSLVKEILEKLENQGCTYHLVVEPVGRNTAPAIAMALKYAQHKFGKEHFLLVLPADHLIKDSENFLQAVHEALLLKNTLITFGSIPTHPHTGYGYLEIEERIPAQSYASVKKFVEKPNFEKALSYVQSDKYLWNTGMFGFPGKVLEREMHAHAPTIMALVDPLWAHSKIESNSIFLDRPLFQRMPDVSIDYALMEKSDSIKTIPVDIGWSDLGDWEAMSSLFEKDEKDNVASGKVMMSESLNTFVYNAEINKEIKVLGVRDLIIVNHKNGILITNFSQAQKIKDIVENL